MKSNDQVAPHIPLYRSSVHGPMRILLPFVSTIDDLDAARDILAEVRTELDLRRQAYDRGIPIGVMIETPAAAVVRPGK